MKYGSAIFDLDGTILESSGNDLSWLRQAVRDALKEHRCEKKFSDNLLNALAGLRGPKRYREVCESAGLKPESFWNTVQGCRAKRKIEFIDNGGLELYDGTRKLLRSLKESELRLGLISNSPDTSVDAIIQYFELDEHFHYYRGITQLEDLERRKPDPWHIEIAKSELKRGPFVYVGDSKVDFKAAEKADMDSVNVSDVEDLVEIKSSIIDK